MWSGLRKQVLSTQHTLVCIMASISCSVCAMLNLFILLNSSSYMMTLYQKQIKSYHILNSQNYVKYLHVHKIGFLRPSHILFQHKWHIMALIKPSRLYSRDGLDWGKQLQWHIFNMYSSNYSYNTCTVLIFYCCHTLTLTFWNTVYFSTHQHFFTHQVNHSYNTPRHAQLLHNLA